MYLLFLGILVHGSMLACFINSLVEAAEEDLLCVILGLYITCSDTLI